MQNKSFSEKKPGLELSQIKEKIILSEFARSALGFKISKNKTMCCHLHSESTPSLHFNDEKKFYYCFGCHKNGDVFSLIQETKNCSFLESVKFAASHAGISFDEVFSDYSFLRNSAEIKEKKDLLLQIMEDICLYFEEKLYNSFATNELETLNHALKYLYNRKIDNVLIKKFRIGYCPESIDDLISSLQKKYHFDINLILDSGIFKKSTNLNYINQKNNGFYSILAGRIIFPIFDKFNKIIAFGGRIFGNQNSQVNGRKIPKYINASDSLIFKKNENLYGENFALANAKSKNQMIIVEGYVDVIMMHKDSLLKNCVAPLGTAISVQQVKSIWNICDEITCCMDGDLAGYKSMISILEKILPIMSAEKFINFVFLEKNTDPADFIENEKIDELKNFLETKKRYPASIIFSLVVQKYKKFTVETIAAVRSILSSYLSMINDDFIVNEYKVFFDKKIQHLIQKMDNQSFENFNENFQKKTNISNFDSQKKKYEDRRFFKEKNQNQELGNNIFDEIFFNIIFFLENFKKEIHNDFHENFELIKNFFKNHEDFLKILDSGLEISIANSLELLKKNPKYSDFDPKFLLEEISKKIIKNLKKINALELFKQLVILKIKIIDAKNKQKTFEKKIAQNDPDFSFEDFEKFSNLSAEQKKLQNDLIDLD